MNRGSTRRAAGLERPRRWAGARRHVAAEPNAVTLTGRIVAHAVISADRRASRTRERAPDYAPALARGCACCARVPHVSRVAYAAGWTGASADDGGRNSAELAVSGEPKRVLAYGPITDRRAQLAGVGANTTA